VRTDRVTTPETTPSAGAAEFVRTYETEAMFEVCVAVPLDLSGVCVPIPTVPHPAEGSLLPMEVGNSPRIVVSIVDVLNRHLGGVLSRRSPESTDGDRSVPAFLVPFRDRGR